MFFQSFGQRHRIKIAICRSGIFERFIIFLLDVKFIQRIIDSFDISWLDSYEVWLDKWDIVRFFEHAYNSCVINAGRQNSEKVGKKSRVFLEIEIESPVVDLKIGGFDDNLFEGIMFLS